MRGDGKICLPPAAAVVGELIGTENVLKLMVEFPPIKRNGARGMEFSGRYIYIPKKRGSVHAERLEGIVGRECFERLVKEYGGDRIYVSNCRGFFINYRINCISELRRMGVGVREIAAFFAVTERYVFKLTQGG